MDEQQAPNETSISPSGSGSTSARLHHLDWLQVIAVLGVFLFHAVQPFDSLVEWNIKNQE